MRTTLDLSEEKIKEAFLIASKDLKIKTKTALFNYLLDEYIRRKKVKKIKKYAGKVDLELDLNISRKRCKIS